MGLRLGQSLVGHSHNLCDNFTPAHLVCKRKCRSKVMWLGWWLNFSTDSLVWLQEMAKSGSIDIISKTLSWGYPCRLTGNFHCTRFLFHPKMSFFQLFLSVISPYNNPHGPSCPHAHPPQYTLKVYSISPSQWDPRASFIFSFFAPMEYNINILYLIANIPL